MIDGFEHGRIGVGLSGPADVTAGTPGTVTTPVRTGLRSLEITAVAAGEQYGYNIAAGNRIVTLAFYIRFATLPSVAGQVVQLALLTNSGGGGQFQYVVDTGRFRITNGTNNATVGPNPVAVDTWYRVVMEYDTAGANAVLRCKVDNGTEGTASTARAAADTTQTTLGTNSTHTFTGYYDDWLISLTNGDYEEISGTWTAHSIESLIPSSDGSHNITTSGDFDSFTGTAFSNSTTNGNTFIGHRPLQFANTADQVIRQELGTTTNYMEFGLENLAAGTDVPVDVRTYGVHVESASAGATLGEMQLLLSDNTEVLTTGSISMINSTEDPGLTVSLRKRMAIRPSGGWDRTKVDGLKVRLGFSDNAPDVNFIDCMIEVALTPAGAVVLPPGPTIVNTAVDRSYSY